MLSYLDALLQFHHYMSLLSRCIQRHTHTLYRVLLKVQWARESVLSVCSHVTLSELWLWEGLLTVIQREKRKNKMRWPVCKQTLHRWLNVLINNQIDLGIISKDKGILGFRFLRKINHKFQFYATKLLSVERAECKQYGRHHTGNTNGGHCSWPVRRLQTSESYRQRSKYIIVR